MHPRNRNRLACSPRPRRSAHGFTLIEVLVAVVLIHVGLLSLVAASAMLVRRTTQARVEAAALQAAGNRLETLGAGPCATREGTTIGPFDLREDWSAQLEVGGTLELRDSVTFGIAGITRSVVERTRVPC
jgi:prepilin-type N-terminal cleavage/methylation domain-containing protein